MSEHEAEAAFARGGTAKQDLRLVSFAYFPAYIQAESGAGALRGEEGLEDLFLVLTFNARAFVDHVDVARFAVRQQPGPDAELRPAVVGPAVGQDVVAEMGHGSLELAGVGAELHGVVAHVEGDVHRLAVGTCELPYDLFEPFPHTDHLRNLVALA